MNRNEFVQGWIDAEQTVTVSTSSIIGLAIARSCESVKLAFSLLEPNQGIIDLRSIDATGEHAQTLSVGKDSIYALAFSPNGELLATGGKDRCIRLIATSSGLEIRSHKVHWNFFVDAVGFSPDGQNLYFGVGNNDIRVWQVKTWEEKVRYKPSVGVVWDLAVSPDGQYLAVGGGNGSIKIIETNTGHEISDLRSHTYPIIGVRGGVRKLIFSPDGQLLASAGSDKTICLWDTSSWCKRDTLFGHTAGVWSIDFSPDGDFLVSGSDDHSVRLWDVAAGQQLAVLTKHKGSVTGVAFMSDRLICSASKDKTMYVLDYAY